MFVFRKIWCALLSWNTRFEATIFVMNPNFSKGFKVPKYYVQDCRYGLPGQIFEFPSMSFWYKLCHEAQSVGIPYFLGEFCKVSFQNLDKVLLQLYMQVGKFALYIYRVKSFASYFQALVLVKIIWFWTLPGI